VNNTWVKQKSDVQFFFPPGGVGEFLKFNIPLTPDGGTLNNVES